MNTRSQLSFLGLCLALSSTAACGDPGEISNEGELITTVIASFTPEAGGPTVTALFDDPDGDGGDPPMVDPIQLVAGGYELDLRFENRLEDPPEDITLEILDEAEEHQIFFTGTAIDGPASDQPGAPLSHIYADADANGLPIGLASTITAVVGSGEMIVTLRHVPELNGVAVKTQDLAAEVQSGGFVAIGGATDVQVTLPVTVQ